MSMCEIEVSATVDYSTDKWHMTRLPLAMWFCVLGLAICLLVDSGPNGALVAFVYIGLLGLAFAGWAAVSLIDRSSYPFYVVVPAGLLIAFVVAAVIAVFGSVGSGFATGRQWWSRLVHPPLDVFGWMLIYLGCGWMALVLVRHFHPARPILRLTPAGLSYHRPWLANVFIPWPEIQSVGPLEFENPDGRLSVFPQAVAIAITRDFYERRIAPSRSILSPPGSERMFAAKGPLMQMVLSSPEVVVDPEELREPIEARWKAFRDRPAVDQPSAAPSGTPIVLGRWTVDGSWWQAVMFVSPLVATAALVIHVLGT